MISGPIIYQNNPIKNNNEHQVLFQQVVFAQTNTTSSLINANNNSSSLSKTNNNDNNNSNSEQTFLRQGMVSSSQARPNETAQIAVILPHRDDGKSYTGVLTFSASQPVSIGFLQKLSISNKTLSNIDFKKYGKSMPQWIRDITSQHNLNHKGLQVISGIIPNYGTSTPYYSASIPFVANGVTIWSQSGTPFLASYSIYAKLVQPEIMNNIEGKNIK